ncbi:MAG: DNA methyltransferase [Planctomycetota bacterium]
MGRPPQKPKLKLQTSTLWYYPSQQHGDEPMGTPAYEGATPTYVIWNLLERYTREGDLVVDPFVGGGTTIDVARSMGRRCLGYDLRPVREDIFRPMPASCPSRTARRTSSSWTRRIRPTSNTPTIPTASANFPPSTIAT